MLNVSWREVEEGRSYSEGAWMLYIEMGGRSLMIVRYQSTRS